MTLELLIALVIAPVGMSIFGRFAEGFPLWRRVLKWSIYFGLTILLSLTAGRAWSLAWVLGLPAVGATVHVWWCRKNGIHPVSAEPRDKFRELMGWH